MFWNRPIETMARSAMRELQTNRLRQTVEYCYARSALYKAQFTRIGLRPEHIRTLEDIRLIPFTVKTDLRDTYPFGMFAADMDDVVRLHASSGTTGKPTVVGYTRADLDMWSECMARLITMAGVSKKDIAQVCFGYGMFTGALGLHVALEKVGCAVIPASAGNTQRQLLYMRDFGTTTLISTPSYALYLAEAAAAEGIDPKRDLKLRVGLFGGEGASDKLKCEIQDKLGLLPTENYGLSEIIGPGTSGECHLRCGLHINEDHFLCEIIDPDTGEVLPEGEKGELVITALSKQALPILRYRTRDITSLSYEPCACGRTMARMARTHGRADDMLIIRGVNVFPTQVEEVLARFAQIGANYEIVVRKRNYMDEMEVLVELVDASLLERFSELETLSDTIRQQMRAMLQVDCRVRLAQPNTLKRFEGKAKRITDLRDQ